MATERTVLVRLKANVSDFQRGMVAARGTLRDLTKDIDTSNNRTTILAQSILGLGPAFVPLSAAAVPVLTGLSTQLLVAGGAAGVATLALVGIGQGLKSLNDYQLNPTTENLVKMQQEMEKLGPAGEHFVRFLDSVGGQFSVLRDAAREGLFPGAEVGITHLLDLLPRVQLIVGRIAEGMGQLAAEGGENLAGPKFAAFFDFLRDDAEPILLDMGHTLGNFIEGLANMTVAFAPLSSAFSGGLLDMSRSFAEWSRNLDSNQSFQDFLQYIQEVGPKALDFLGALIEALAAIVEAAAPVGALLLPAMTGLLNVITALAHTPLAPVFIAAVSAISLYARAVALAEITTGGFFGKIGKSATGRAGGLFGGLRREVEGVAASFMTAGARTERESARMRSSVRQLAATGAKAGGAIALIGVAATGVADNVGLSNAAMGAAIGLMAGPWGVAAGAAAGGALDLAAAIKKAGDADRAFADGLRDRSKASLEASRAELEAQKRAIEGQSAASKLVNSGAGYGASRQLPKISASDRQQLAAINKELEFRASREGATNLALLRDGMNGTAAGAQRASLTVAEFQRSIEKLNQALTGRANLRDYEAAIDDFTKSLKDNGHTLDINTEKGRANQAALDNIATTALNVAKTMKGVDRERFLDNARKAFIRAAREAGLTRKAAQRLANELLGLDGIKPKPKVDLDKSRADAKRKQLNGELDRLDGRNVQPTVTLGTAALYGALASVNAGLTALDNRVVSPTVKKGNAEGGIPFGPFAGAVYGPGGPKDDLVHALLSNGEHVLTAEEVARIGGHGAVYAMRAQIMAGMPAFANGGGVDRAARTTVSVAAPRLDLGGVTVMVRLPDGRMERGRVEQVVSGRGELLDARRRDGVRTP